jgi:hypothetical protein
MYTMSHEHSSSTLGRRLHLPSTVAHAPQVLRLTPGYRLDSTGTRFAVQRGGPRHAEVGQTQWLQLGPVLSQ